MMTGPRACALATTMLMLAAAGIVPPAPILAQIQARGPKAVVAKLSAGDGAGWDQVLQHIQAGTEPWLHAGLALRPGTDAGTGEGLTAAMATALLHNAPDVLRLAVPAFGEAAICAVPLIEPSAAQVASYVAQGRAALARVTAPDLAPLARRCSVLLGK